MATESNNQSNDYVIGRTLDSILENLPIGSVQRAIGNNLYGINFRQTPTAVPRSKDQYGFTFFTRPQLNLSTLNITNYRGFYSLLTKNKMSYQRFTRAILDPRIDARNTSVKATASSPFVNRYNPFISILTNNLVSLSGWPDLTVPIYTSPSGLYGEEFSMVDGVTNHFEAYDLDVTFRNTLGNPIIYMFYIWIKYQTLVFEGILNPYFDMIAENEIDYNTRIYRLVMDKSKRFVTQIACTGATFPMNVPTGNLFDYNTDTPYNTKNGEINIRFRCMGFLAFEDLIKMYFNQTVAIFNPDMRKVLQSDIRAASSDDSVLREDPSLVYEVSGSSYVKIPYMIHAIADTAALDQGMLSMVNKAIPYINLYTNELEWWISKEELGQGVIDYIDNTNEGGQEDGQ